MSCSNTLQQLKQAKRRQQIFTVEDFLRKITHFILQH